MIHWGSFKTLAEAQAAAQGFRNLEKLMKKPREKPVKIQLSVARAKLLALNIAGRLDAGEFWDTLSHEEKLALQSAHRQLMTQIRIQSEEKK